MANDPPINERRPFQFSLRTLFEAVAWFAVTVAVCKRGSLFDLVFVIVALLWLRSVLVDLVARRFSRLAVLAGFPVIGSILGVIFALVIRRFDRDYEDIGVFVALLCAATIMGVWSGAAVAIVWRFARSTNIDARRA